MIKQAMITVGINERGAFHRYEYKGLTPSDIQLLISEMEVMEAKLLEIKKDMVEKNKQESKKK